MAIAVPGNAYVAIVPRCLKNDSLIYKWNNFKINLLI